MESFGVKCEKSLYNRDYSGRAISACARMNTGNKDESWKSKKEEVGLKYCETASERDKGRNERTGMSM